MAKTDDHSTDSKLGDFAEDLGKLLGSARNKAEDWLNQRKSVAEQLERIRDTASAMLERLTSGVAAARRRGRPAGSGKKRGPGKPPVSGAKKQPGRPKRRTMSAEARAKIAAAQKKRWAKVRAEKKA